MTSKIREQLPAYAAALFPLISIAFGKGYGYAAGLVLLAALFTLFPIGNHKISASGKYYTYVLAFYFISFLITVVYTQNSLSDLDRPSRALLAIPIFIVLLREPPNLKLLMSSFILGAYAIGVVGLFYYFMFPEARAFDDKFGGWWTKGYMQIQTGGMAATLSVSGFVLTLYLAKHKHILLALLALGGALFALFASLASGSRGSWLFLPLALLYFGYVNRHAVKRRTIFLSVACSVLVVILASQTTLVQTRIAGGTEDMQQYLSGTNKNTSLGIRLELWKSAFYTFTDYPILGSGTKERVVSRLAQGQSGLIDEEASKQIYHAHNQFLENLSMYGIVGLAALLSILFYPLYLFEKVRRCHASPEHNLLCQLGSISIIMMIGYCTTQAFFNHNSGITYYLVYTSILLAAVLSDKYTHT